MNTHTGARGVNTAALSACFWPLLHALTDFVDLSHYLSPWPHNGGKHQNLKTDAVPALWHPAITIVTSRDGDQKQVRPSPLHDDS